MLPVPFTLNIIKKAGKSQQLVALALILPLIFQTILLSSHKCGFRY